MDESSLFRRESSDQLPPQSQGLRKYEKSPERLIASEDIESFRLKVATLHETATLVSGLERAIVNKGIHLIVDTYGADKFIRALVVEGMIGPDGKGAPTPEGIKHRDPHTLGEVMDNLGADKQELVDLAHLSEVEDMQALGDRFNQKVGGVATIEEGVDHFERHRRIESDFDSLYEPDAEFSRHVMGGQLARFVERHPEVLERLRQSNDLFALLKDIRDIYATEYNQLSIEYDQLVEMIDKMIEDKEALAVELQNLSNSIHDEEIRALATKLASAETEEAQNMIQVYIDRREAEKATANNDFAEKIATAPHSVITQLNAGNIESARPHPLPGLKLVYKPRE